VIQHEITEAGTLLDPRGRLRESGWARKPLLTYDRSAVGAPLRRIKEWDYYCVLARDFGVAFTVADNGYIGIVSASVLDFNEGNHTTETLTIPFPLGSLSLPGSSEKGDVKVRHKSGSISFSLMEGGARVLKLDFPGFGHGSGLRGVLVLNERPGADSIVTATPWRKKPSAFYYNRKVNCLAAEGVVQFGDAELIFPKGEAFGVFDWGRGVWPYGDIWYWASTSWMVDGKMFGINVGYGFGDTSAATENALFVDGRLHKLGAVTFRINPRDWLAPWHFTSEDGRLDMTLTPKIDRSANLNMLIYSSVQHQLFGTFSGRAILDDGSVMEFKDIPGFAEKVKNRW